MVEKIKKPKMQKGSKVIRYRGGNHGKIKIGDICTVHRRAGNAVELEEDIKREYFHDVMHLKYAER